MRSMTPRGLLAQGSSLPFPALSLPLLSLPPLPPLPFLGEPSVAQSRWSAFFGLPSDLQVDDDDFFGGSPWWASPELSPEPLPPLSAES